jgi:hypothetical protein
MKYVLLAGWNMFAAISLICAPFAFLIKVRYISEGTKARMFFHLCLQSGQEKG